MKQKKFKLTISRKKSIAGILFISPWLLGFLGLFLRSIISSIQYSVCDVKITTNGLVLAYKGFANYLNAFIVDLHFVQYLTNQISSMLYYVPVILGFSLFMAVVMNAKFKGRTFVRAVFFLPVIAGSGIILSIMQGDAMSQSIISGARSSMLFKTTELQLILLQSGLRSDIVSFIMGMVSGIFNLSWKSGLQIILFIAGLQTVPQQLYESAHIEGATAWEAFWMITFPMITPILMVSLIYTIIDGFTDFSNNVMQYIQSFGQQLNFSYSSTLSWIYFIIVFVIIGIVYAVINKKIVYTVD